MTLRLPRGAAVRRLPAGLSCTRPQPHAQLRLVCFAHAGGGPQLFRHWADLLSFEVEVWTVTLPGRGSRLREQPVTEWKPLLAELSATISAQISGPIAIFGHSLGALLAFEVARCLTAAGIEPAQLVVSGRPGPAVSLPLTLPADDLVLMKLVDERYGGVPEEVLAVPELVEHFAPILRSDLGLVTGYDYHRDPVLSCPIAALAGIEDSDITVQSLAEWGQETTGDFVSQRFPGGHFYLTEQTSNVLETLRELLIAKIGGSGARTM